MFYCNEKKANWYLERNLATLISQEPLSVQLTFTPNGDGNRGNDFYLTPRINRCVVCGATENLTKHHCVPYCYRKYFQEDVKKWSSHDVLLSCYSCHKKYEVKAHQFKKQLAVEYGIVPKDSRKIYHSETNQEKYTKWSAHKFAVTLKGHGDKIPEERKNFMLGILKEVFNTCDIDEILKHKVAYHEEVRKHGLQIVNKIKDVEEFCKIWRQHFLDHMNPQFMPQFWDINYSFKENVNEKNT